MDSLQYLKHTTHVSAISASASLNILPIDSRTPSCYLNYIQAYKILGLLIRSCLIKFRSY